MKRVFFGVAAVLFLGFFWLSLRETPDPATKESFQSALAQDLDVPDPPREIRRVTVHRADHVDSHPEWSVTFLLDRGAQERDEIALRSIVEAWFNACHARSYVEGDAVVFTVAPYWTQRLDPPELVEKWKNAFPFRPPTIRSIELEQVEGSAEHSDGVALRVTHAGLEDRALGQVERIARAISGRNLYGEFPCQTEVKNLDEGLDRVHVAF